MAHVAKYQASALGKLCGHYNRWIDFPEHGIERENIDASRTYLNYNLAPEHKGGQVTFVRQRIESLALKRAPRKDAVRMCDCVLTKPQSLDPDKTKEFFRAGFDFLAKRYGIENTISAYVHMDETTPHMHYAWVPVTKDGRLSAKDVVNRQDLRTLHRDMQTYIEHELGCKVEIILEPEKEQEKALSNVPQKQLESAREGLKALEVQKEALAAEIAAETARLEYLRLGAREIGEEVDVMAAAAAKIDKLESSSRREYSARCREITTACDNATTKINRGIEQIRERIIAVKQRIQQITQRAKQCFSLENRARQATETSRGTSHQSRSYGRDVGLDR